ncbi:hypothetical protein IE53DRAFT_165652 [Violaceomyces palustris]|uniref:Uncharacterized protein n=1 Tax=Violaceomyces palustris TaxID=1673888 RepID=A0ACD0NTC3_9BASI|nr:hypothetical protein IE53DRAFT_165652 [Violaceomyces palustris]
MQQEGDVASLGRPPSTKSRASVSSIRSRLRKSSSKSRNSLSQSQSYSEDNPCPPDSPTDQLKRRSTSSEAEMDPPPLPPKLPPRPGLARSESNSSVQYAHGNAPGSPPPRPSRISQNLEDPQASLSQAQAHSGSLQGGGRSQSSAPARGGNDSKQSGSASPPSINPFKDQAPTILTFFCATGIAVTFLRSVHWSICLLLIAGSAHYLWKKLERAGKDAAWEVEMKQASQKLSDFGQDGETVEWLNKSLATLWPLINADCFAPFVDLLEDSLMTQVPGIVHGVRVEDVDQGSIPLRIKSFRVLESDDKSFIEGAVAQAKKDQGEADTDTGSDSHGRRDASLVAEADDDDTGVDTGDYVNLEITFAYRGSRPGKGKRSKTTTNAVADRIEKSGVSGAEVEDEDVLAADTPAEKIHMLIYMSIGLQKIAAVEVPVWVEMVGIEGKMRLRLQMTPVAPFVKHAAVTFVGPPALEMSAKPLGRKMVIDAMNLPLISSYALRSVEEVIQGFIAPKSYTVDVAALLGAGDGPQDTYAVGVICLVLHQAIDLAAADVNGKSDPFVQASFARAGKPLFTTRVIVKTREPIWQETCFLLVSPDEIRDHERLRLTVFDADRFSADDPLGRIDISIDRLIRNSREKGQQKSRKYFVTRTDDLMPMRRGGSVQGKLKYSVGFFSLAHSVGSNMSPRQTALMEKAAERGASSMKEIKVMDFAADRGDPHAAQSEDLADQLRSPVNPEGGTVPWSSDQGLDQFMTPFDRFINRLGLPMDDEVLKKRMERKSRVAKLVSMIEGAKAATRDPPSPEFPSGILAFHIHAIHNLEIPSTQRSYSNSKRLGQKQRYTANEDATAEGSGKLPSSYVQVLLNDEAVFRTRTKTLNPRPYINGGSERFIGDWTTARIDFVVRDQRMREGDPIIGCVGLRVSEVLKKGSRSCEWYTLTGGLGFGKIKITILFRSIEISVPRPLRGWNVGVLEVGSCRVIGLPRLEFEKKECHVLFETVGGKAETTNVEPVDEHSDSVAATVEYKWPLKGPVRVPVRQRYPSFLYIHLRSESRLPGRHHTHAHAVIPLNRMADDVPVPRRVPLFETTDWHRFEQDMLRASTKSEQLVSPSPMDERPELHPALEELCEQGNQELPLEVLSDGHIKRIGWLEVHLVFHSGIGPEHRSCVAGDAEMRYAFDSYVTMIDAGERPKPNSLSESGRQRMSNVGGSRSEGGGLLRPGEPPSTNEQRSNRLSAPPATLRVDTGIDNPMRASRHRRTLSNPETEHAGVVTNGDDEARDGQFDGREEESLLYASSLTNEDLYEDEGLEDADPDTAEGRRARQRNLHRQQRGAAQIKGFRTLSWLKTNAEDGVGRMKKQFDKQSKRLGKMESEGVSHF